MTRIVKIDVPSEDLGRKFRAHAQPQADPALVAEGWELRFTTDLQRAQEVAELYSQLGYEVRAEPVLSSEVSEECGDCHSRGTPGFKTIYTRSKRT